MSICQWRHPEFDYSCRRECTVSRCLSETRCKLLNCLTWILGKFIKGLLWICSIHSSHEVCIQGCDSCIVIVSIPRIWQRGKYILDIRSSVMQKKLSALLTDIFFHYKTISICIKFKRCQPPWPSWPKCHRIFAAVKRRNTWIFHCVQSVLTPSHPPGVVFRASTLPPL